MSMFANAHGFRINNGRFSVVGRDVNYNWYSNDPLQALSLAILDVDATHDSEKRYPPPQCHPETRREVLETLSRWIHSRLPEEPIFWLYGPAGAGKSAIAQTIAEMGKEEGYLISSFFFSRDDPKRNTAKSFCLTIAYGLASSIPELRIPIGDAIRKDPILLHSRLEEQFTNLIVNPCMSLPQINSHPWLIVIDGLDECNGSEEQQRILFIIARALPKYIRVRFLICSRPEPHIREAFDTIHFRPFLRRVTLDESRFNSSRDIEIFFFSEFRRIRNHPRNHHIPFPNPWPAPGVVYELVHKASGQFIYAATVVKFVDNEYSNPCTQLEFVLHTGGTNPELGSPFYDLDALYHQILSSNPQRSKVREIIRVLTSAPLLHCRRWCSISPTPRYIEALLLLCEGDVILTLRGMHSIFDIGGPDDEIRNFHKSFTDFICDPTRSTYFCAGDEENQHSFIAASFLRAIDHYTRLCGGDESALSTTQRNVLRAAWETWGTHCSTSNLSDGLLDLLRNGNFPESLGLHLTNYLTHTIRHRTFQSPLRPPYSLCSAFKTGEFRIQKFFSETAFLLRRLQKEDSDVFDDITNRFSDLRRGFRVRVLQSTIPHGTLSQILETAAIAISRHVYSVR